MDHRSSTTNIEWLRLLSDLRYNGHSTKPRGLECVELLSYKTTIDMSKPILTLEGRKLGKKFLAAEAWWILSGRNDVGSISPYSKHISSFSDDGEVFFGAYGPRIMSQIQHVVGILLQDPASRQAVIDIWRENPPKTRDCPCTLSVQWLVRDVGDGVQRLYCIDTMRSSDAWLGWPYDTFNFSMVSAAVAIRLRRFSKEFQNLGLGSLTITAGSQHYYVDPKRDGNDSIPYSQSDVERVLTHPSINSFNYAPLDLAQFSDPQDLVDDLSLLKDGKFGNSHWMREFWA